jgi:hypothetical protein
MIARCKNPQHPSFKYYGAKGIVVCPEWKKFENFLSDMGIRPEGTTLGRIDNSQGYYLANCRWETDLEQGQNRTNVELIEHEGKRLSLAAWARLIGIGNTTLHWRKNAGWTVPRLFEKV